MAQRIARAVTLPIQRPAVDLVEIARVAIVAGSAIALTLAGIWHPF